jgi:hypothetical protein
MGKKYMLKLKLSGDFPTDSLIVGRKTIRKHISVFKITSDKDLKAIRKAVKEGIVDDVGLFFGNVDSTETVEEETVEEETVEEETVEEETVEEEKADESSDEEEDPADIYLGEDGEYYCPIEDCEKHKEGYSRKGDLTRHMNSKHPDYDYKG